MAFYHDVPDSPSPRLGCPGCGACKCSRLGETYETDDAEPTAPSDPHDAGPPPASRGVRPRRRARHSLQGWSLADDVTSSPPGGATCTASERRILRPVEPTAQELLSVPRAALAPGKRSVSLHRDALLALLAMRIAAAADGIPPELLTVVSGYRSVRHQQDLWEGALRKYGSTAVARRWVAPPGASPHHSGRAVDLWLGISNKSENVDRLRATRAYHWLVCNAARFGFFPYAREPWHWEYNPPHANPATP